MVVGTWSHKLTEWDAPGGARDSAHRGVPEGVVATLPEWDLTLALELANTFSLRRGRAIDGLATRRDVAAWLAVSPGSPGWSRGR